jgi:hypothetical protein
MFKSKENKSKEINSDQKEMKKIISDLEKFGEWEIADILRSLEKFESEQKAKEFEERLKKLREIGIKYDDDKPRWDLLPLECIAPVVDVLTYGAKKYTPDNWKKVAKTRYIAARGRHRYSRYEGEWLDPESRLPHIAHELTCLIFEFWHEMKERGELEPPKPQKTPLEMVRESGEKNE